MNMIDRMTSWLSAGPIFGTDDAWAQYKYNLRRASNAPRAPWEFYQVLRAYYDNSGLYDQLTAMLGESLVGGRYRDLHGLRNPAARITEFYVAHIWPGNLLTALPIEVDEGGDQENLTAAIRQVWKWSNWGQKKQPAVRTYAMLGDLFIKVVGKADVGRVYFERLDPDQVIEFDKDERGYITYARIDIPRIRRIGGKTKPYVYTEEWSKDEGTFRRWEHNNPIGVDIEQLGEPSPGDEMLIGEAFGIDFVPIVHSPFRDTGDLRGVSSFRMVLDKIDEVNRKASRLSQQLFRHNDQTWVLERSSAGGPGDRANVPPTIASTNEVNIGGERILGIPAGWTLRSQIPDIKYESALAALQDDMTDLQQDAPEMAYWRMTENMTDLSGRAIRLMLGPAIQRAEEARGNAEEALVRANQMACTIAQNIGIPGFSPEDIGTYQGGNFEHAFEDREIIASSPTEEAEAEGGFLTNLTLKQVIGIPNRQLQLEAGYSEEEVDEFEAQQGVYGLGNTLLDNFDSGTGGEEDQLPPADPTDPAQQPPEGA